MSAPTAEARSRPLSPGVAWALALGLPAVLFLARLGAGGIWDPFELNVADLARRVAVNALGATSLVIEGSDNSMPHLGDLGRNDLPIVSIALGFKLFGLHEWAGRLPLALWGLVGVAATYLGLSRLADRRAGVYGALVLATMPLYFAQARTMLGDVVTMAAVAVAFFGLAVATFDRGDALENASRADATRRLALPLGLLGAAAGFDSRGPILGVAVPALSVGLAWAVAWGSGQRKADRFGDAAGLASFLLGAAAAWVGLATLFRGNEYSIWLGSAIVPQSKFPTFDHVILYLGHSLFPWSAFIPFAVGRLFREPTYQAATDDTPDAAPDARASERESDGRLLLVIGSTVAFGAHALVAPRFGYVAFVGVAMLAGIAAVAIRDFERGAPASQAVAVGVAILAALYLRDYNLFPEKALSAFAVNGATFPDSFREQAHRIILVSTAVFAGVVFLAWMERDASEWFEENDYVGWARALRTAWEGALFRALVAIEAALVVIAVVIAVGLYRTHWPTVMTMSVPIRQLLLNAAWIAPVALYPGVWLALAVRDAFRAFLSYARVSRAEVTMAAGVIAGAILGLGYYPALAAQLSPKDVFEAYGRLRGAGEQLALLGVNSKTANYYAGSDVKSLSDVSTAFQWLGAPGSRRWIVLKSDDLPKLNSLWRTRPGPHHNLPVLDARSSQILLGSSALAGSETSRNPLDSIVLDEAPTDIVRVGANLQDQLENLGWEVREPSTNQKVDFVVPSHKYRFRIYWKVLAPVTGEWETFIHIDGFQRRYNGDHKTAGGKYSFSLWQPGDVIVDDHEFALEPNFTPGPYAVYYGLFVGDSRMKVKTGRHDDNRIDGGKIVVK